MSKMSMTISVHYPVVRDVKLYQEDGSWVVTLGDAGYGNSVSFFVSSAQWDEIVATASAAMVRITADPTDADVIVSRG